MEELKLYVKNKAKEYLEETGESIDAFPTSIVDFVIECFSNSLPSNLMEEQVLADIKRCKNAMAMACVEVYSKAGAEGQASHSENGISRAYEKTWISNSLFYGLPNYAKVIK